MNLSANAVFGRWAEDHAQYGPKALSAALLEINKSETRADEIVTKVEAEVPLPNNRTTITLYV